MFDHQNQNSGQKVRLWSRFCRAALRTLDKGSTLSRSFSLVRCLLNQRLMNKCRIYLLYTQVCLWFLCLGSLIDISSTTRIRFSFNWFIIYTQEHICVSQLFCFVSGSHRHMSFWLRTLNHKLFISIIFKAKDKEAVLSRFSAFAKNVVSEQEQIAHKLLGEKFQVIWLSFQVFFFFSSSLNSSNFLLFFSLKK